MGGLGRIYFSSISQYAERYAIDGSSFDQFVIFIRVIDEEYIDYMNEKQKAEQDKQAKT